MAEVESLRASAARLEHLDAVIYSAQINALCRGSLVLLSSHLEAYIKELGETFVTKLTARGIDRSTLDSRVFYHISKDRLDALKDTSNPKSVAKAVFDFLISDYEFWAQSGPFPRQIDIERFNKGFSNPTFTKIKSYFNRFGFEEYSKELGRNLRANYLPYTNMVNHLVDIRNKIAHGDPTATKTPQEVRAITLMIKGFCNGTDSVFAQWCKEKYCAVR